MRAPTRLQTPGPPDRLGRQQKPAFRLMPEHHIRFLFRLLAAGIGWFALALQYWLAMTGDAGPGPLQRSINFFSYFTILTNLLAALAMTMPTLTPASALGRFLSRPGVRGAITAWIIVVAAVYALVLQSLWSPQGLALVADMLLHYVVPILFVLDWLMFVPRRELRPGHALAWLAWPAAYAGWSLLRGAISGFYPYPFLEVPRLGYGAVGLNMAAVLAAFAAVGALLVMADRLLPRKPAV